MQTPEPASEHQWLQGLVGDWTFEGECRMGPDEPVTTQVGRETVRSLGGLWTVAELALEMPEGGVCDSIQTLGYDPQSEKFVGTFVASVMTHLWPYSGTLDAGGKKLTLDTKGPNIFGSEATSSYQDIIELLDDDQRTMTSQILGDDGQWQVFMKAHYRRVH